MSNYDREQREMDGVERKLRLGLMLQVLGGVLWGFDAIIVCFVWVGLRSGSFFWLYWTVIEAVAGLVLLVAGSYYKDKAGSGVSRLGASRVDDERKAA